MLGDIGIDQCGLSFSLCGSQKLQLYLLLCLFVAASIKIDIVLDSLILLFCLCLFTCLCTPPHTRQRALLEQKQKKKRQEPLMVQSTVDGRSRTRRTKQSEEQAPLVESYLSSNSSTIYNGEEEERSLILGIRR